MDLKNMTAKGICGIISGRQRMDITDDEWLEINEWLTEFLKNDPPPEEKKMFVPLGWGEALCMICDGITRWRNSICIRCEKQRGYDKHSCSVYQEYPDRIPNEIWASDNPDCPYFLPIIEE